ncbi:hypothetical protein ACNF42_00245 [Cuniculiplasma sp. SKW3]|uniref:hypothetical protein n=1 Tax=unclassified Cuniculiplasma TaxID=2619706 RepID=UPI003FD02A80
MRELEKFEINALELCKDEAFKEKMKIKLQKKSKPIDPYELKKLENKIEKINKKYNQ